MYPNTFIIRSKNRERTVESRVKTISVNERSVDLRVSVRLLTRRPLEGSHGLIFPTICRDFYITPPLEESPSYTIIVLLYYRRTYLSTPLLEYVLLVKYRLFNGGFCLDKSTPRKQNDLPRTLEPVVSLTLPVSLFPVNGSDP